MPYRTPGRPAKRPLPAPERAPAHPPEPMTRLTLGEELAIAAGSTALIAPVGLVFLLWCFVR